MTDSERLDLSSASSAYRRRRCTGSENLIRQLRKRGLLKEIPPGADAISGTASHAGWAGQDVQLDATQEQTVQTLKHLETLVVTDWCAGQSNDIFVLGREVRLWLRQGIEPLHSGQYDCAYVSKDWRRALILDAKTLYGEVDPAEHNDQLRELVALFRFNYPQITHYTVAILAPNHLERVSIATYDMLEAELALRLLRLSLLETADPDAVRTPGRHCDHCPALSNCEEARQLIGHTHSLAKRIEAGQYTLPLGEKGARILQEIDTVKKVLKSLQEAYKRELAADPDCLPGWHLKNGKRIRQIDDIKRALELWSAQRLDIADFLSATEISISKLEAAFGNAIGARGKRLTDSFNTSFAEVITLKEYAPELERDRKPKTLPAS